MTNIQEIAVIRDRGQLTIPDKIREALKWPSVGSVVSLATTPKNELLIKPFQGKQKLNWSTIWMNIDLSRSYIGKRGNLSSFIISDRKSH